VTSGSISGSPSGSSGNAASGVASGMASGVTSGASSGATSGTGITDGGALTLTDGSANTVPADYTGKPFKGVMVQIPGIIHVADYDTGGPGVAYCHGDPMNCNLGINTGDWRPGGTPVYRPLAAGATACGGAACNDNAGICRMNAGEPDNYAQSGPTWIAGANGPTLTGPMETVGTLVMPQDVYICYMVSPSSGGGGSLANQWSKYTVQVTEAGTYAVGGMVGSPAGVTISLDFGGGITTGAMAVPTSPTAGCRCPETYHSWEIVHHIGRVTFPAPGVYLMTFTLLTQQFNPDYFTFTKM
jgi:hypothetical protein